MVGTRDAAQRLHVTPRHVQRLVREGELVQLARGVIDAASVERHLAVARQRRVPWAPDTAWAAIALLSGQDAPWLGPTRRSRLRARLRTATPVMLLERCRARAAVTRYDRHPSAVYPSAVYPSAVSKLRALVVEPLTRDTSLTATSRERLDGYIWADVVDEYGLTPDSNGTIVLRTTTMDPVVVVGLAAAGVLGALGLAESRPTRARRGSERSRARAGECPWLSDPRSSCRPRLAAGVHRGRTSQRSLPSSRARTGHSSVGS